MHDTTKTDWQLLDIFSENDDQDAFTQLVERHLDFVHGVARRTLGNGHPHIEDVVQAVFILLSKKAAGIPRRGAMAGWLFRVTRYCCANVKKTERHRREREHEVSSMRSEAQSPKVDEENLVPLLDSGLAVLSDKERQAMLLHFLQSRSTAETARQLGISAAAAEKRLERAMRKLRQFFQKRGFVVPAGAIVGLLGAESAKAAPAALAGRIIAGKALAANVTAMGVAKGAAAMMAWHQTRAVASALAMAAVLIAAPLTLIYAHASPVVPVAVAPVARLPATLPVAVVPIAAMPAATRVSTGTAAAELPQKIDVAALMGEVRGKEKWIESIASFHVKADSTWTRSQQAIDQSRAELTRQLPDLVPLTGEHRELDPLGFDTLELAFTREKLFYKEHYSSSDEETRIWDGVRSLAHRKDETTVGTDTSAFNYMLLGLSWPRADRYTLWWETAAKRQQNDQIRTKAEDYTLLRRETWQGIDCYVLKLNRRDLERLYVGVADHLLYRIEHATIASDPNLIQQFIAQAALHDPTVRTQADLERWLASLSVKESNEIADPWWARFNETSKAGIELWMRDYVELKPGCWFPLTQGNVIYDLPRGADGKPLPDGFDKVYVKTERKLKITEVQIDKALPDRLFQMELGPGDKIQPQ